MNAKLLILLPPREGFRPDRFGAISLCIHDASLHSRYRERIEVAGTLPGPGFDGVAYRELALHRKWYQTQTRAYANACLESLKRERPALVEIHNAAELEIALACDPKLIGINNRDLASFTVSLETTYRLKPLAPAGIRVVAESGIHTREDVAALHSAGVDAVLVGEALVTAPDVQARVRSLAGVDLR